MRRVIAAAACATRSPRKALIVNAYPGAIGFYERLGFGRRESAQHLPPGIQRMERILGASPPKLRLP